MKMIIEMKKLKIYILALGILLAGTNFGLAQIKVTELKKPLSNKIVIKVRFANGSVSDPAGKQGLTQLTAAVIDQGGTASLTKSQIDDMIYPMAAYYYEQTDKEVSTFTFEVPKAWLNEFYPILKGLILTPSFTQGDFDRVKSNQLNYLEQVIRASSDEEYSKKALEEMLFEGTTYQHMVSGTVAGVKSISLDDVQNHYKNYFTRNNVSLGIAGNYSDEFLAKLKADMGQLADVDVPVVKVAGAEMPNGVNVKIISKKEALGSAIFTGYPIDITRADDEFAALMIANSWLGEHRKSYSKLYQKIRQTRSMNYGDYTYIEWYERGGSNQLPLTGVPRASNYFAIWIRPVQIADQLKDQYSELEGINVGHAHFALRMALREMDLLKENGMSQEDFELTKQFLRSYMKLYIQTPAKELGFLMDSRFFGRTDYIAEMDALLENVTLEEVNAAIKKHLQTKNIDIVIITDDSEAEPLAKSLRNNTLSPMSYSNQLKEGLSPEVLAEDDEVAEYSVNINSVEVIDSSEPFQK